MPNFKLSRKAKADLKSTARYTEREWGRNKRNHYIFQFDHCFHLLGENPSIGQCCDEISPDYRLYPQGSHIIFYRQSDEGVVEIIRILHKRMLPEGHLL
ncbi:type II toxin-antitoxin system RelE/ParE family toxin [Marinobacterium sp. D7]|uniref:type II toxin-antitoxin system RelE/ParE family toxin n=1 Tax=Marinobacterium ramblicola TaxID=2849041 RepID=UPI001C2D263C|nr:type II toxin-antitoxin system RelE/ParE family toxin [Marinobacterium ramblicola]MBV1787653.1 type II toxin-antitoxin system RelE/ParE family toxin [Marinobacterium ramblicola]